MWITIKVIIGTDTFFPIVYFNGKLQLTYIHERILYGEVFYRLLSTYRIDVDYWSTAYALGAMVAGRNTRYLSDKIRTPLPVERNDMEVIKKVNNIMKASYHLWSTN